MNTMANNPGGAKKRIAWNLNAARLADNVDTTKPPATAASTKIDNRLQAKHSESASRILNSNKPAVDFTRSSTASADEARAVVNANDWRSNEHSKDRFVRLGGREKQTETFARRVRQSGEGEIRWGTKLMSSSLDAAGQALVDNSVGVGSNDICAKDSIRNVNRLASVDRRINESTNSTAKNVAPTKKIWPVREHVIRTNTRDRLLPANGASHRSNLNGRQPNFISPRHYFNGPAAKFHGNGPLPYYYEPGPNFSGTPTYFNDPRPNFYDQKANFIGRRPSFNDPGSNFFSTNPNFNNEMANFNGSYNGGRRKHCQQISGPSAIEPPMELDKRRHPPPTVSRDHPRTILDDSISPHTKSEDTVDETIEEVVDEIETEEQTLGKRKRNRRKEQRLPYERSKLKEFSKLQRLRRENKKTLSSELKLTVSDFVAKESGNSLSRSVGAPIETFFQIPFDFKLLPKKSHEVHGKIELKEERIGIVDKVIDKMDRTEKNDTVDVNDVAKGLTTDVKLKKRHEIETVLLDADGQTLIQQRDSQHCLISMANSISSPRSPLPAAPPPESRIQLSNPNESPSVVGVAPRKTSVVDRTAELVDWASKGFRQLSDFEDYMFFGLFPIDYVPECLRNKASSHPPTVIASIQPTPALPSTEIVSMQNNTCVGKDEQTFDQDVTILNERKRKSVSSNCEVTPVLNEAVPKNKKQNKLNEQPTSATGNRIKKYCSICEVHYFGRVAKHRKLKRHQTKRLQLNLVCTDCNRSFDSGASFAVHYNQVHKKADTDMIPNGDVGTAGSQIDSKGDGIKMSKTKYQGELVSSSSMKPEDSRGPCINGKNKKKKIKRSGVSDCFVSALFCELCGTYFHDTKITIQLHCESLEHSTNLKIPRGSL